MKASTVNSEEAENAATGMDVGRCAVVLLCCDFLPQQA